MLFSEPARPSARRSRSTIFTVLVVTGAALGGIALARAQAPSPSIDARPPPTAPPSTTTGPLRSVGPAPPPPPTAGDTGHGRAARTDGEADGAVPDGTTVFDGDVPAVGNLDPALLGALRRAATDAARDGVRISVTSGWRSPAYQSRLLREAVATYGSEEEAARWVATPETSAHVSGDAIDIGPARAMTWLATHGRADGLCRVYGNEAWHFELRPEAVTGRCPAMYPDPTHDPRMQR